MKIQLPQVGESVTEGIIGKWLKEVGSKVEKFDPLVEIVTDKVAMELPSPVTGILKEIIALEGETVPMGAVIADIESDEQDSGKTASIEHSSFPNSLGTTGVLLKDTAPVGPTGSGGQPNTDGLVVEKDPKETFKWFRAAAEQGHWMATGSLGECYRDGIGVEKNPEEAEKWLALYNRAFKQDTEEDD